MTHKDPYSPSAAAAFLRENFQHNQVMRARLTNLIDGIRAAEFERGYNRGVETAKRNMRARAKGSPITEDIILLKSAEQ